MFRSCIVLAVLLSAGAARAEQAVLECTADTWTASGGTASHGRDRILALSPQGSILLQFRAAVTTGWTVRRATLLLHLRDGKVPRTLRFAAIEDDWSDGSSTIPVPSKHALTVPVRAYGDGWIAIELPAAVPPHGFALLLHGGAALTFDSRESIAAAPYLLVEGSR